VFQIQEFVAHEVEMVVSTADAERSLQLLLDDREALSKELASAKRLTVDAAMARRINAVSTIEHLQHSMLILDLRYKSNLYAHKKNKE